MESYYYKSFVDMKIKGIDFCHVTDANELSVSRVWNINNNANYGFFSIHDYNDELTLMIDMFIECLYKTCNENNFL